MSNKKKKTKEQKAIEENIKLRLTDLMELKCPLWLTPTIYRDYLDNFKQHRQTFSMYSSLTELFPVGVGSDQKKWIHDSAWDSWLIQAPPKFLVDRYEAATQTFISTPDSGQDVKTYTEENKSTAAFHAGNHWGWKTDVTDDGKSVISNSPSQWIQSMTFNLARIDGKLVIIPVDCEHRMWGVIGFPMGLVPLESEEDLWYYDTGLPVEVCSETNLIVNRIKVNGMYIHDIVAECAKHGVSITTESVKNRFYANTLKCQFLPMYSQPEMEYFFRTINSASAKTPAQLFHAQSFPTQYWIKDFTSIKVTNFTAADKHLHPLYENMAKGKKIKLEPMMIAHTILGYNLNGRNFVTHSDKTLINDFRENEIAHDITDEVKVDVIRDHDYLYSLISSATDIKITRELAQHLLNLNDVFESMGKVISDKTTFMHDFDEWFTANQKDDDGKMTLFAGHWRKNTKEEQEKAYGIIVDEFLEGFNTERLLSLGVVPKASALPRGYSEDVIKVSYLKRQKRDLDNKIFVNPVGAHFISDMELSRMTDVERDELFKSLGLGDKYDHNKNCVATSSYHNQRMGVLRISEYLPIINDDKLVKETKLQKYNELKAKPILI